MAYIHNITFAVSVEQTDRMVALLRSEFLPIALTGGACNPLLTKVVPQTAEESDDSTTDAVSLCLQLRFETRRQLDNWTGATLPSALAALSRRAGDRLLYFPTIMQVI